MEPRDARESRLQERQSALGVERLRRGVTEDLAQVLGRVVDPGEPAAGPENADELGQRTVGVGEVVKHVAARDDVEAAVRERELARVGELGVETALRGLLDRRRRSVDAHHLRGRVERGEPTVAAADVEDARRMNLRDCRTSVCSSVQVVEPQPAGPVEPAHREPIERVVFANHDSGIVNSHHAAGVSSHAGTTRYYALYDSMTTPPDFELSTGGAIAIPAPHAVTRKTPSRLFWDRLKQDKAALIGGVVVIVLILTRDLRRPARDRRSAAIRRTRPTTT